ncbi:zinc ABC transporter substrate-binding protein [Staphylococcus chromogenes]|nr:zinc ABC transporter substrate-binding protein [Staphylococcus chromogenes]
MKKRFLAFLTIAFVSILLVACGQSDSDSGKKSSSSDKLQVKTTVFPVESFIKQIGGKHVDVESIYPKGTDLHSYEPSQKDILDASKSDLFVYTGDNLDPVAKKVAGAIKEDDKKLSLESHLNKSELLKEEHEHEHDGEDHDHEHGDKAHDHEADHDEHEHHHHGMYDPHVWLDPKMNETMVKAIRDELSKKDPSHKAEYKKNADELLKELDGIDKDMKKATEGHQGDTLYVSHESLGYLAKHYGFKQQGVQNMNAEDPSQKELTDIVKAIKDSKTKYILYEENVSNKVTDTIRQETDAQPLKFNNMESVSKSQSQDATYQSLMKENIKNIEKALNK